MASEHVLWSTCREWRNNFRVFWHNKNACDALWKPYNLQVWINFIHWFYWLIDHFNELFKWTRIPTFHALVAVQIKTNITLPQIQGLMDVVGVARHEAYFEIGDARKTGTFGDENVMSLVPNDIFASRDRVLR